MIDLPNLSSSDGSERQGSASGPVWKKGRLLVEKMKVLGQHEREPGEGELSPSASQQEDLGGGNGSRVRTLPAAAMLTQYRNSPVIMITDLFALGIRNRQRTFDSFWINVRSVNLFPEHSSKILDLEFRPIDESYPRTV